LEGGRGGRKNRLRYFEEAVFLLKEGGREKVRIFAHARKRKRRGGGEG